jgi:hypothetical protein
MTSKQIDQYNRMLEALRTISGHPKANCTFMTPDQIRRSKEVKGGFMEYEEVLEMSYDNIQRVAKDVIRGVAPIVTKPKETNSAHSFTEGADIPE